VASNLGYTFRNKEKVIMKTSIKTFTLVLLILLTTAGFAQRTLSGIVYMNGKPQAGVVVEAQRSNDKFYTSFDGKYEIKIHEKTKFLKFTFLDESKRMNIDENTPDVNPFSFDGKEIPEGEAEPGVILKTIEQLSKDRDMEFLNPYSLYREFFKQEDYKSAMPHWRKLYKFYPKSTAQIYIDGVRMYDILMEKAPDAHTKSIYLDSIMMVFDKRIKYMDNVGELLGRKAAKYLETILQPSLGLNEHQLLDGVTKGYGFAEKSIKESGNKSEPTVVVLFMQSARKLYSADEITKSTILENYENSMAILESQLSDPDLKENAEKSIQLVEQIIEGSGALDCKALVELYEPKFKQTPDDISLLKKMARMLRKENCTESEFFATVSENLYKLEPSADAAFNMANMFVKRSAYDKAFEYYEKAYSVNETEPATRATYYYFAGMLGLQRERHQFARDMAREALKLRPDYCEAMLLMGEVFGQAGRGFSSDDFERTTVYWLAVDYFEKASRISGCATDGSSKSSFYSNYFPNREEVFFRSLTEGQRYTVGGWINESTTVRVKR
jgi:tetratricopeptide (TPR) repeat protein